jgi:RHS repeat-associated protein
MLLKKELSKSPSSRFLTMCVMYLFFFNTISTPFLQYAQFLAPAPVTMAPVKRNQAAESIYQRLITHFQELFVGTAEAADDVQTSIHPTEFSVEMQAGVPRSAGDMGGDNGASGSVNLVVGSYGYTYPIPVPPGRGGFAPTLALNYSSSGPNASIGLGWDLSLGSISRSTKYGKPNYDDDDTFVISIKGSSIMLVREGNQYWLKDEGLFLRIIKEGDGWVATDKDGTDYFFGTTEQSRQTYALFGTFKWCLDRIRDANGNEIHILYQTDLSGPTEYVRYSNNQIYPVRINYDVNNSIQFIYDKERPDAFHSYSTFFKIKTAWRLDKIIIRGGSDLTSNLVRTYQLKYEEAEHTRQSLLKQITLIGAEGNPMPPTVFDYADTRAHRNAIFTEDHLNAVIANPNNRGYPGDYNADGVSDMLVTGDGSANSWDGWKLYLGNREYYEQTGGATWHEAPISGSGPSGDKTLLTGDFNGDGKTDIMAVHYPSGTSRLYISTGSGFEDTMDGPGFDPYGYKSVNYLLGDFNGDGRMDVLMDLEYSNGSGYDLYCYTDDGFEMYNREGYPHHQRLIIGDFNGDSFTDFLRLDDDPGSANVWINWGSDVGLESCSGNCTFDIKYEERLVTGDFNGDGKTDILATWNAEDYPDAEYDGYRLLFANGENFVEVERGDAFGWRNKFSTGDFNGDGKTDLIVVDDPESIDPAQVAGYELYNATGSGFEKVAEVSWDTRINGHRRLIIGDYNGDGRQDMISTGDHQYDAGTDIELTHWSQLDEESPFVGNRKHLLGEITSPLGADTFIEYTPSSAWTNIYLPMTMQTVSRVTIQDNMPQGTVSATTYKYSDGAYNPVAREFRGFGQIIATDETTGVVTESKFHQDDRFQGRLKESITWSRNSHKMISTKNTWEAYKYGSGRTFAFVRRSEVSRYDDVAMNHSPELARITTVYDFDNFGNLLSEDKTAVNLRTNEETRRFTRTHFINDEINWILGKPDNIRIDTGDPGLPGAPALRETRMTYDPARPWLLAGTTLVRWDEDDNEILSTTNYEYDAYGNNTRVTDPRNPDWALTTSYDESSGVFPNRTTNALGQTVHRVFDPRFGVVLTETDANDQTTTTDYDEYGRISHVAFPDGATNDYTYHIEPGNHHVTVTASESPTATVYYDNLDRKIKEAVTDGTQTIVKDTVYDAQGHVLKLSLPHYVDDPVFYTTYEYDQRDRLRKQINPDGTYRTIDYEGFDEIIHDEKGHAKRMTKDALGRLVQVAEPTGGITQYAYDLFDNLTWVKDPLNAQTTIAYDELGRKIAMDDPYMGHWEYRYDAAGNLVWQMDAENRAVEMTYDALNRPATKTFQTTGKTIQYTYDEERSGFFNIGRLTTKTATEPGSLFNTIAYDYDLMGRTVQDTHTIDGTAHVIGREYDLAGRVRAIAYPHDSTRVEYAFDPMGRLQRVDMLDSDGTPYPVVQYGEYNAMGQTGFATYGNGANTTYEYQAGNFRLKRLQTQAYDQTGAWGDIQDVEYNFDDAGNVEAIDDHVHAAAYSFEYDSVNRLQTATAVSDADPSRAYSQAYTYDLAGNMTEKSGRGGFKVRSWQDPEAHIQPAAVLYASQTAGVGTRDMEYDQDDKPTRLSYNGVASHLFYDAEGNRVKKASGGNTTVYVGGLMEIRGAATTIHIFAGGRRIASVKNKQKFFTHADHLGSTSLVTDAGGRLVEEVGYLPFGATLFRNAYQDGIWTSVYRFTGQEYDTEFALYNYNARLYDPVTGRFITADTVVPDWTNPQSLNRYAYCMNNPLRYVDPSGHFWGAFFAAIVWGALIGAAVGGFVAAAQGGDVVQGIIQGATTGAISGAFFYAAGAACAVEAARAAEGAALTAMKVAIHAQAGAMAGAINASITGGNAEEGIYIGGLSAGMAQGLGSSAGARVFTGAVIGGVAADMAGDDFAEGAFQGAWTTAAAICMRIAYKKIVRYDIDWKSGGPAQKKGELKYPIKGANNIGVQGKDPSAPKKWYSGDEGSAISKIANRIPGINAVAGMHDVFQVELEKNWGTAARTYLNIPGMPVAAAMTYSALITDPMATFIYYTGSMKKF